MSNGKKQIKSTITFNGKKRPKNQNTFGGLEEIRGGLQPHFVSYKHEGKPFTGIIFFDRRSGIRSRTSRMEKEVVKVGNRILGVKNLEIMKSLPLMPIVHPIVEFTLKDLVLDESVLSHSVALCLQDLGLTNPDYATDELFASIANFTDAIEEAIKPEEGVDFSPSLKKVIERYTHEVTTDLPKGMHKIVVLQGDGFVIFPIDGIENTKGATSNV